MVLFSWLIWVLCDRAPCDNWWYGFNVEPLKWNHYMWGWTEIAWCKTTVLSPCSVPSLIYFPLTFLRLLFIHSFFRKGTRYSEPGRKSVRCWSKTYPAYSPRGYYLCYLWAPAGFLPQCLSWRAWQLGPAWHRPFSSPSGLARHLALELFLKRLEFSQNIQLPCSVLFKPKVVFLYFSFPLVPTDDSRLRRKVLHILSKELHPLPKHHQRWCKIYSKALYKPLLWVNVLFIIGTKPTFQRK